MAKMAPYISGAFSTKQAASSTKKPQVGSSVPEPRRLFFRGARLRFIWTESGLNLVPATMHPSSDGFLRFCHEALWSLLRATKRHKAACGFCFRHPVGTLNSRGLWSRGQHRPHKIRRGTSRQGFVGLFLVTRCNFSAKQGRNLEFCAFVQGRVLGIPAAPYHGVVRHPTTQKSLSPWP